MAHEHGHVFSGFFCDAVRVACDIDVRWRGRHGVCASGFVGYGSRVRFEFGVHGVGFSGDVGRSERSTVHVRWKKSVLFVHRPSLVFSLHLAVRRSRRAVRLFRQFLPRERSDEFKHEHSVVFVEVQVGKEHFLRRERVSVDSVVSWRPSVGDSFDGEGVHFWLLERFEYRGEDRRVYHAANSKHVEHLLGANDRE